jgi:hypothetical protein
VMGDTGDTFGKEIYPGQTLYNDSQYLTQHILDLTRICVTGWKKKNNHSTRVSEFQNFIYFGLNIYINLTQFKFIKIFILKRRLKRDNLLIVYVIK